VTAETGRLTSDRENAYFRGNVKAVRDAEKGADGKTSGPITLTTEYLHVMPREDRAMSDKPVTIQEPRGIIRANGFVLNDRDKTIVVKNGLRGTIEPQALPK
jgi:LPS export ABC transporter protein LptC